jgi:hypothetical protein
MDLVAEPTTLFESSFGCHQEGGLLFVIGLLTRLLAPRLQSDGPFKP